MKSRPVGAEYLRTDRRTKSVVAFRISANAPATRTTDFIRCNFCPITAIFGSTWLNMAYGEK